MAQKDDPGHKLIKEGLIRFPQQPSEQPHLIGSRCRQCGYVAFPKKEICPACVKEGLMEEIALSRRGKLNTFTLTMVAPPGFQAPYIQGYVDLPEGCTIFTLITGCEPREDALQIGQEVELVVEPVRVDEEGNQLIGYKFKPV